MAMFFIQESSKKNKLNNILNRIVEKNEGDKIILELPMKIEKKLSNKKMKKILNKIEQYRIKTVVLSERLYKIDDLRKSLYSKNIKVLDGKYLFKLLLEDSLYYICSKANTQMEKMEISLLINEASETNKNIIISLANKVRTLNIITDYIEEFRKLEEYLYNEKGIIVKVSNNYKTAMKKTNIIINTDFTEKNINKYVIPNKCIIININENVKIKSKKFNGININDYNIIIPKKYKIKGYNDRQVYESYLINEEYKNARKRIVKDKTQIQNLVGEKGIISNRELEVIRMC